jgi:hypothetical protein
MRLFHKVLGMDDRELLEICLKVTGTFESNAVHYDAIAGNFDGQGLSAGVLQWNAGQGTLQILVRAIILKMGVAKAQSFFKSDIAAFSKLFPSEAIAFAQQHYLLEGSTHLSPAAIAAWHSFLETDASIAAQQEMAIASTLDAAKRMAAKYMTGYETSTRVIAFFFDLINQQGSIRVPVVEQVSAAEALSMTECQDATCYADWSAITAADPIATRLLYYAYERAKAGNPQYVWDTLSRRGTIACLKGRVHGALIDLTHLIS